MRVAWSSASVFNLSSANPAGLVPPEEQETDRKKIKETGCCSRRMLSRNVEVEAYE